MTLDLNLLRYIWRHTKLVQIWIIAITLASMPVYFYLLEIPKRIIDGPIEGLAFPNGADTQRVMRVDVPFTDPPVAMFDGFDVGRVGLLLLLCGVFLLLVVLNGWIKLYINTLKGVTSERIIRRLRYDMCDRILRFPIARARQLKPSEVSGIIKDEVDLLTDFVGESFSAPLFLGGQAITGLVFLFIQSFWFGVLTMVVICLQLVVIPMLRRRLIELGKQRQITARAMAGRIGEVVQGIDDHHLNDTSNYVRADIAHRLGRIFTIRLELFKRKFTVKFINNLLMQVLSILFYLIGGYLVIAGSMELGALVASIAAYKDLPGPVRGLIDWDQQRQMAQVRYGQAIEGFLHDDLMPPERQSTVSAASIAKGFEARSLTIAEDGMAPALNALSAGFPLGQGIALISQPADAPVRLLEAVARLRDPTSGKLLLDDVDLATVPEALTGRSVGYADDGAFLPGGSIRNILLEALRHRQTGQSADAPGSRALNDRVREANKVGNTTDDPTVEWLDRARLGLADDSAVREHLKSTAFVVGIHDDICEFGLNTRLSAEAAGALATDIGASRRRLRDRLAAHDLDGLVEPFDPLLYNIQSSIAENLLFGLAVDPTFAPQALGRNPIVRDVLGEVALQRDLVALGTEVARNFVDMLGSVSADSPLFEAFKGLNAERVAVLREIIGRTGQPDSAMRAEDEGELLALAMGYVEPRDRFALMTGALQTRIVEARRLLRERVASRAKGAVAFHEPETYNPSLTIMENVLFGKIDTNLVGGRSGIADAAREMLVERGHWDAVFEAGLGHEVALGGKSLSTGQRQRLRLARALVKKPSVLILNRACAALPAREQRDVLEAVLKLANEGASRMSIICAPTDDEHANLFDRVIRLEHGRLVADGAPSAVLAHA